MNVFFLLRFSDMVEGSGWGFVGLDDASVMHAGMNELDFNLYDTLWLRG